MAPSTTLDSPSSPSITENSENNLQPFFVLHKAMSRKSDKKAPESGKARRWIDLSQGSAEDTERVQDVDHHFEQLHIEAFDVVWSKIETSIGEVLRDININIFKGIHQWICESFSYVRSTATPSPSEVCRPYPPVNNITCRQIFTGLVLTKNVEFVDDLLTFKELNMHLRSHGCHVVNLCSLDFSAKNGIGGCLRNLLRQLVPVPVDAADIAILASWYIEPENFGSPLVVIIDDMERCCGSVLSEFILMLSEWVVKLPVILVMGVTTTIDAPRILLTSDALQKLCPYTFSLGSPSERLDAVVQVVLLNACSGFDIGYNVAVFLRNYFLRQDGTVTSFIKGLKIACAKHFLLEPLSFLCEGLLDEDSQNFWEDKCAQLPELMLKYASNFQSCQSSGDMPPLTGDVLASGLSEIKRLRKVWRSVFLCLYEAANLNKMRLLDILCEALDPALYSLKGSPVHCRNRDMAKSSSVDPLICHGWYSVRKGGFVFQAIRKVRDLPAGLLHQLIQNWAKHTVEIAEIHDKVKELQSMLKSEDEGKSLQHDGTGIPKGTLSRCHFNMENDTRKMNEKAVTLIECMVRDYLKPVECAPFHEIICFKHVDILQSALIGDPRRTIQVDLLKSHNYLQCTCCTGSENVLLPSMHDTSIMYTLAQEHGDLINLHDWFQSFKSTIIRSSTKKRKVHSPSPKKRKNANEPEVMSDALVQARFCRAVTELQITGLLRMPSKRRPDFVQRVAFGL